MNALADKRILLVEDELLIAEMVVDMLVALGATVVGPALSLASGLSLAGSEEIDAAVLDVNLRGESIGPVAELLAARGIPMLFATGYGMAEGVNRRNAPVIDKPYTQEKLASALARAMAVPEAARPVADRG